jgi:tetratricopeptide (TPR) repeat protein
MTDDHPTLEYSAPRSLYRETRAATLRMLEPLRLDSVERSHYDGLREETANLLAQRRMDRGLLARAVESYWTGGWAESLRLLDGMGKIVGRDRQMLSYRESVLAGLVTEGGQRLSAGDLDGAIGRIRVVPVSSPHRGQLAARIAQACRQAGRPGEARGFFAEALSDPASSFDALLGLGELAEAEGRPQEAESRWREAIRLRPDVGSARLRLAAFLVGGGRIAEARAVCQEALRINPADANARQMLEALPRN